MVVAASELHIWDLQTLRRSRTIPKGGPFTAMRFTNDRVRHSPELPMIYLFLSLLSLSSSVYRFTSPTAFTVVAKLRKRYFAHVRTNPSRFSISEATPWCGCS